MKSKILVVSTLLLVACSSQTRIGDDTYLFHEQSKTTVARVGPIYERALERARVKCIEEGYTHLQVLDQDALGSQYGLRGTEVSLRIKFFYEAGEGREPCKE